MSLDGTFGALADPTRRSLVERLAAGPVAAGELASGFSISRPAVAKHLRVLKQAGLVEDHALGRQRLYQLAPGAIEEAGDWMRRAGGFWEEALASFKRYVEEER